LRWMEKMEDTEQWTLVVGRRRLTQGCSAEKMDGYQCGRQNKKVNTWQSYVIQYLHHYT
jgi:hypothetical protein